MIIVGRHEEGISLNPLEYILDTTGHAQEFKDKEEAIVYLKSVGFTDDDIYYLYFEEV